MKLNSEEDPNMFPFLLFQTFNCYKLSASTLKIPLNIVFGGGAQQYVK